MRISDRELKEIIDYVYQISRIKLNISKKYLIQNYLGALAIKLNLASYSDLIKKGKSDNLTNIKIIDAITVNETSFFRDKEMFDMLKLKIIPEQFKRQKKAGYIRGDLKIWSAACATGQEAHSISMILKELLGDLQKYKISILGTDISDNAVKKASSALYDDIEISRGLAPDMKNKFFDPQNGKSRLKNELLDISTFRKYNLMNSFSAFGKFDIILCRNVAIYFTPEDKKKLFKKLSYHLNPNGVLIVGSTENPLRFCSCFIEESFQGIPYYILSKE